MPERRERKEGGCVMKTSLGRRWRTTDGGSSFGRSSRFDRDANLERFAGFQQLRNHNATAPLPRRTHCSPELGPRDRARRRGQLWPLLRVEPLDCQFGSRKEMAAPWKGLG